jgi:SAM-dependent methyltransferase
MFYLSSKLLLSRRYFSDLNTWKKGNIGLFRNPEHFINIDADLKKSLDLFLNYIGPKDLVLDLGCNVGRVMNYLLKNKINNIHGVDVMESTNDLRPEIFPELSKSPLVKFFTMPFNNFFRMPNLAYYDCIITVGATIELIHPSEKIIKKMCKITKKFIFCYINEENHQYPKLYIYEFYKEGFKLVYLERIHTEDGLYKNSILIFKNLVDECI